MGEEIMSVVCASSAARARHVNMTIPLGGGHTGVMAGTNGDKGDYF